MLRVGPGLAASHGHSLSGSRGGDVPRPGSAEYPRRRSESDSPGEPPDRRAFNSTVTLTEVSVAFVLWPARGKSGAQGALSVTLSTLTPSPSRSHWQLATHWQRAAVASH